MHRCIQLMENLRTKRRIEIENDGRSGNRGQREWRYRNTMENAMEGEKNYKRRGGRKKGENQREKKEEDKVRQTRKGINCSTWETSTHSRK